MCPLFHEQQEPLAHLVGLHRHLLPVVGGVRAGPARRFCVGIGVSPPRSGLIGVLFRLEIAECLEFLFGGHVRSSRLGFNCRVQTPCNPLQSPDLVGDPASCPLECQHGVGGFVEQVPDLVETQVEFAVRQDLLEPGDVTVGVSAVAILSSLRRREQSDVVVVVQRSHGDPGEPGNITDGCGLHGATVDHDVT